MHQKRGKFIKATVLFICKLVCFLKYIAQLTLFNLFQIYGISSVRHRDFNQIFLIFIENMSSIGTGYDLAASTFSPDGRIFQGTLFSKFLNICTIF